MIHMYQYKYINFKCKCKGKCQKKKLASLWGPLWAEKGPYGGRPFDIFTPYMALNSILIHLSSLHSLKSQSYRASVIFDRFILRY